MIRTITLVVLMLCVAACSSSGSSSSDATGQQDLTTTADVQADLGNTSPEWTFPSNFLWGTATAGFQVDMGCPTLAAESCNDANSDWYVFITDPATLKSPLAYLAGDPPSSGPGHWELFESDFDLIKNELANNSYRFSFEWSRIFPTATDGANDYEALKKLADPAALARYHKMLDAMKQRGITPLATLIHYTLPTWIHDAVGCHKDIVGCSPRGWVDRERTVREAAKYAGFMAREFGDKIDWWVTLNEPYQVLLFGYVYPNEERTNPPAVLMKVLEAKVVMRALIEAHARMYDAIKENDKSDIDGDSKDSMIGVVYPLTPILPKNPQSEVDKKGAENVFYLWNQVYLNAVIKGEFDENLDKKTVLRDDLKGRMDYVGLNYYFAMVIQGTKSATVPGLSPLSTFQPFTMEFGSLYPRGFYEMLMLIKQDYDLPVVITENGLSDKDGSEGPRFLVTHLRKLRQAMKDGVDVRGYFYWSLLDNYEWNHGMNMHFGLYHVDPADPLKKRVKKPTADVYSRIVRLNGLPDDLLQQFPDTP